MARAPVYQVIITVCFLVLNFTALISAQGSTKNSCIEQKTCGACISAGPECAWCLQEGFDVNNRDRCDTVVNLMAGEDDDRCEYDNIIQPANSGDATKELAPVDAEDGADAIQLSPQEYRATIRPKSPYKFNVTFRQAENYPVDLYYIMDLSYSMADDKDKVADLGTLLSEEMVKITKNFRLGFGSFIDKKTMPYVSTVPASLISPCTGCVAPYGFKNQLPLSDQTSLFSTSVRAAEISGNLDSPEGGFDAMMQAIVCQDIGWRTSSRKLLVFSTDANFHAAGDGLLGGIVTPNDGVCHLDTSGYYSESLNQDYPSISQISNTVSDNNVNVIFAVTADRVPVYKKLAVFIDGSVVGELANDSSNIVTLVKQNYEEISGTVEMNSDAEGDDVIVRFKSYCVNGTMVEGGKCDKVGIGQSVTFEVEIEVTKCPADPKDWNQVVKITPTGLAETLTIDLSMICACDCEDSSVDEENSPRCSSNGTYECGACTCNPGFYGKNCECDGSGVSNKDYDAQCRQTNTSEVCHGHGECLCGVCDCNPVSTSSGANPSHRWSGKYCECNDYSCDYYAGELCGGPERGVCVCGTCQCNLNVTSREPLYVGNDCGCATTKETCRDPDNGKICNGHGDCICGECVCHEESKEYRGPTCSDCPTCPGQCEESKDCVQCTAFQTGSLNETQCEEMCSHVTVKKEIEGANEEWLECRYRDEDNCFVYYSYKYDDENNLIVEVQKERDCPIKPNWWLIIALIILAIILIGLLLLCLCKILVTLYDRREYAKFEKELEKAKWDMAENPIFKPATSTYTNPMK